MKLTGTLIGGAAALIVLVAAAAGGWWFFIREDAKLATNAPAIPADLKQTAVATRAASSLTPSASGTALSTGGSGLTFKILSDRSEAAYFADEKLASLPLPSKAKGSTKDITGQFQLTADGFDLDTSQLTSFTVNLKTLSSDKSMRDSRVQSQGLETSKYPTATFAASKVTGFDSNLPADQEQTLQLSGTLDLHGVKKDVVWDVKAKRDGNIITALATLTFRFGDFNIPVLNIANFVSVQDTVTLQVQVVAQAS
jgi:polyisoprenoid-binding protein YceI